MYPTVFIKVIDYVSKPSILLPNKTMNDECIPRDWKIAYASLIFKKKARNKTENYRLVSLTSIVCKLMESILKELVFA